MRAVIAAPILIAFLVSIAGCGDADTTSSAGGSTTGTTSTTSTSTPPGPDPDEFSAVAPTCVYQCPTANCPEALTDYACQNLGAWTEVPHTGTCEAWDGVFPTPQTGSCTATAPTGESIKYAGIVHVDPRLHSVRPHPAKVHDPVRRGRDGRREAPHGVLGRDRARRTTGPRRPGPKVAVRQTAHHAPPALEAEVLARELEKKSGRRADDD